MVKVRFTFCVYSFYKAYCILIMCYCHVIDGQIRFQI